MRMIIYTKIKAVSFQFDSSKTKSTKSRVSDKIIYESFFTSHSKNFWPALEILVLIKYVKKNPLNIRAQLSTGARGLNYGQALMCLCELQWLLQD